MNPWPSATPTVDTTSDDTSKMVLSSKSKLLSIVEPEHELTSPPDDSDDTPVWVNDSVQPTPELQSRTCGWRGCEFSDDCWRKRELPRKSTNICTTNSTWNPRVTCTRTSESSLNTSTRKRTPINEPRCSLTRPLPDDKGPKMPESDEPSEPLKRPRAPLKPPSSKWTLPKVLKTFVTFLSVKITILFDF